MKKRTSHGLTLCAALTPASLLPVPRWGVGAALVDAANQGERRQTWLKRCDAKGGKPVHLDRAVYCLCEDLFVDIGGAREQRPADVRCGAVLLHLRHLFDHQRAHDLRRRMPVYRWRRIGLGLRQERQNPKDDQ